MKDIFLVLEGIVLKNGTVPSCKCEQVAVEASAKVYIYDLIFIIMQTQV
jgi:hypothetical protein